MTDDNKPSEAVADEPKKTESADAAWQDAMNEQANHEVKSADDWSQALAEQKTEEKSKVSPEVPRAQLESLQDEGKTLPPNDHPNLAVILDIPVTLSMEVGKTQIPIRELLQLNQGSVVELNRFAGEPLDVFVNGKLIAHGEVVVLNEKFGIRLTDVVSASERIKELS